MSWINPGYRELAVAVVRQALEDLDEVRRRTRKIPEELYSWFTNGEGRLWCEQCGLNRLPLERMAKRVATRGIKPKSKRSGGGGGVSREYRRPGACKRRYFGRGKTRVAPLAENRQSEEGN